MAPPKASAGPAVKAGAKGVGKSSENILTKKIGPLPGWAWAAVAIGGLYLWKKHQAAAAATTATTATPAASLPTSDTTAPSGYGYQGPGTGGGSPWGPGWNVGLPTGVTGTPGVNPGGVNVPAVTTATPITAPAAGSTASILANTLPPGVASATPAAAASGQSVANEQSVYSQTPNQLTALGYSPAQQALYYDPNPADLQAYNNAQPGIPTASPPLRGAVQ